MKGFLKSKMIFTLVMVLLLVPFLASNFIRYGSVAHASGRSNGNVTANPAMANANLSWILTNGPMTTAHGYYGAAKLQDGRVLAISGDSNGGLTPVTDVYNPDSRTWSQTGAVNQPRYGFYDAVTLNSGKVLIAGGTDATASTDYASAELYDPSTGKWGYTGSLNTARRNPVVVKLQDGRVLVASGANGPPNGNRFLFTSEIYDPATGQFTYTTGNLPLAREGGDSGVLLHDGQVMMLGGEGPWLTFSPEVELYNPASDTWSETGSLPHGISGGSLVVLQDGRVMLIGGDNNGSALAEVELYDPATGTWSAAAPLHHARDAADSILLPNGKVLVAGGSDGNGNAVLAGEIYDPAANSWTDDALLQHMHVRARMIQLDSGELLMAGGYDSNGPTTASELYTSTPPTPHNQVVIFLQGISSALTLSQISNQIQSGHSATSIVGLGYVPAPTINSVLSHTAQYFEYSYEGSGPQTGNPIPYNCQDTFNQPIYTDITLLHQQIVRILATQPTGTDTDLYLVGHSLGGAIALGYLDFLEQRLLGPLPSTAHLKAVITLDSPLGGVTEFYTSRSILQRVYGPTCPLKGVALNSPTDLQKVYSSTSVTSAPDDAGPDPQGGALASFLVLSPSQGTLPTPLPSNEDLAEKAQTDLGTSVLAIGNQNDFLWNLGACVPGLQLRAGDIRNTQYVEDGGDGSGTYARSLAPMPSTCPAGGLGKLIPFNHTVVLIDADVQTGISNFLPPLLKGAVGGTPSPLPINPYQ